MILVETFRSDRSYFGITRLGSLDCQFLSAGAVGVRDGLRFVVGQGNGYLKYRLELLVGKSNNVRKLSSSSSINYPSVDIVPAH